MNRCYCFSLMMTLAFFSGCTSGSEKGSSAPPSTTQTATNPANRPTTSVPLRGHVETVEIKGMKFNPEELTIRKGDTVVWVNNDLMAHCITEVAKKWTSSAIAPGSSWKRPVTESTDYYCAIHVVMKGKVKVEKAYD